MNHSTTIPLGSRLYPGLVAVVDTADLPLVAGRSWTVRPGNRTFYATCLERTNPGERPARYRVVYMHNLVLRASLGTRIDHRDGNGLNNTRGNLRRATGRQNARNVRKRAGTTSRFKGVSRTRSGNYSAGISVHRVRVHLGTFADEAAAARAYDAAARRHFGAFAAVNFAGPGERCALTSRLVPLPIPSGPAPTGAVLGSPEWLAKIRGWLGLSHTDLATVLGVTRQTVGRWETNRVAIPAPQIERIAALCERFDGQATETRPARIRAIRAALGIGQREFGRRLGVTRRTVGRWETGRVRVPTRIIARAALLVEDAS